MSVVNWYQNSVRREWVRFVQLRRPPVHRTTVPPGPNGRPGERLLTPSLNEYASQIAIDGSRYDVSSLLSRRGSRVRVVCLGRSQDRGSPLESARYTGLQWQNRRIGRFIEEPAASHMAGCDAITYVLERNNGETLREWKFVREGWLFVAGILRKPTDRRRVESLALESLATWDWVPGTERTIVRQRTFDSTTEVAEITDSMVTAAPQTTVWALIRNVQYNAVIHQNVVDAFHVPGTPEGIGEEQAVVLQFPGYRYTHTSVIVEEIPLHRIVTRTRGDGDPFGQQIYLLESDGDGTRLTVTMKYSVALTPDAATKQATVTRGAVHDYVTRVADVLATGWTEGP